MKKKRTCPGRMRDRFCPVKMEKTDFPIATWNKVIVMLSLSTEEALIAVDVSTREEEKKQKQLETGGKRWSPDEMDLAPDTWRKPGKVKSKSQTLRGPSLRPETHCPLQSHF